MVSTFLKFPRRYNEIKPDQQKTLWLSIYLKRNEMTLYEVYIDRDDDCICVLIYGNIPSALMDGAEKEKGSKKKNPNENKNLLPFSLI